MRYMEQLEEEYPVYPITATRIIAWDSPSSWIDTTQHSDSSSLDAITTTTTFQPLTSNNLSIYSQSSPVDSKTEMLARYYSSMRHMDGSKIGNNSRNNTTTTTTTTKNVAIDAHPLPFPYHNDSTFLPTVETGRTRFDSESTQSLYDSQPSSPTLSVFSSSKRHLYTATRGHHQQSPSLSPSNHRYRRGSNVSHYSTATGRRSSFQATRQQLHSLLNKGRVNNVQRRLSFLLPGKKEPSLQPNSIIRQSSTDSCSEKNNKNHHASTSASTTGLDDDYHQQSTRKGILSSQPTCSLDRTTITTTPSPRTTCTFTTESSDTPTVISSSTFHDASFWQPSIYMASPSSEYQQQQRYSSSPHRKDGLFSRFAKKLWPFKHV
ncbi:uncharacterized protein BX664DRAFT_342600 [Halteromyces radiatus]|uniref:uncharacterized protein n=1 Tax=Halteromyces radiatus TaxID=101107 RepID=UPI00221F101B|nr:uncharacterized protein BX664DRAFT_342600 [Halteromyces radiatus]KAI8078748.1 hypothetical protein BX664DRAFT_342600 [Halteromyces radiatus]